jgi:hypothetical protein
MKNKFTYAFAVIAFTILSANAFAQKTVAYIHKDAPITQAEKTATFQVVLDNIDNDSEKNDYLAKLKGCKQILAINASEISDRKVTYTITMEKQNIFLNFQNALTLSNIENEEFFGTPVATAEFGQFAQGEYNKTKKAKRVAK